MLDGDFYRFNNFVIGLNGPIETKMSLEQIFPFQQG